MARIEWTSERKGAIRATQPHRECDRTEVGVVIKYSIEKERQPGDAAPCDSCGAQTRLEDLQPVRRLYYEDIENPEPVPQEEVEMWCSGCRETYPNTQAERESGS